MKFHTLGLLLFSLGAGPHALAQNPGDTVTTEALGKIEWIKGSAPSEWEPGKVYLLECWATWCGPCIAAIPHIDGLYDKYEPKGLRVIGMNVWDKDKDKITEFVEKKGDRMSYPISYTPRGGAFETEWLKPAGIKGIPRAFVVKDGKVLFSTHPIQITEEVIEGLLQGGEAEQKAVATVLNSETEKEKSSALAREFQKAMNTGDLETAEAKLAELRKLNRPGSMIPFFSVRLLLKKEDWAAAEAEFNSISDPKQKGMIAFNLSLNPRDTANAPASFQGHLADAMEAMVGDSGGPDQWLNIALLRWHAGTKDKAISAATKATELAATPKYAKFGMEAVGIRVIEAMKSDELPDRSTVNRWINEGRKAAAK